MANAPTNINRAAPASAPAKAARKARTKTERPEEVIKDGMTAEEKQKAKGARFTRLAKFRVNKALTVIRQISNLSGGAYFYTEDQVGKIKSALGDAVKDTMDSFVPRSEKETPKFDL